MRSKVSFTAVGLVLLVMAFGSWGCDRGGNAAAAGQGSAPAPTVTVVRPVLREVSDWDEYAGKLAESDKADIRARVGGYIDQAPFDEGKLVKKGDLLFVIDVRTYEAQLKGARADLARAEAQQRQAESEFRRIQPLREQQAISEQELTNAQAASESSQAAVAAAQATISTAQLNVEWCRITAPISGRAGKKLVTPGNLIAGGNAVQGTLLTTITAVDPVYCYVEVDEQAVRRYQQRNRERGKPSPREPGGQIEAQLQLEGEKGFSREGHIDFVDNRVDPGTATLTARGVFPNPTGELLPGFFAHLRIPGRGPFKATLIPERAVGTTQAQQYVLLVGADDVVQYRTVTPGGIYEGMRSVDGIGPDDRVIVEGLVQARPGLKVVPQEVSAEPAHAGAVKPAPPTSRPEGTPVPSGPAVVPTEPGRNNAPGGAGTAGGGPGMSGGGGGASR